MWLIRDWILPQKPWASMGLQQLQATPSPFAAHSALQQGFLSAALLASFSIAAFLLFAWAGRIWRLWNDHSSTRVEEAPEDLFESRTSRGISAQQVPLRDADALTTCMKCLRQLLIVNVLSSNRKIYVYWCLMDRGNKIISRAILFWFCRLAALKNSSQDELNHKCWRQTEIVLFLRSL